MSQTPLADPSAEARRIVDGARRRGVMLRLIGGLAIRQHCQVVAFCERDYSDIDVVGLKRERRGIRDTFAELGYNANEPFNALHGDTRLEFVDLINDRHVDVFLDAFEMDHRIDLRHRLAVEDYTVSLGDLLLSKLQIVWLNEKDMQDILTLLKDCGIGHEDAPGTINIDHIIDLCACDWGLWKTLTINIEKVMEHISDYALTDEEGTRIQGRLAAMQEMLVESPKCVQWKLRGAVGERTRWYDVPEEQGGDTLHD